MMALRMVVSLGVCGLLAVTAYAGTPFLAAAVVLIVLGIAVGWWALLALPDPRGTALAIALSGVVAVAAAAVAAEVSGKPLTPFAGLLAFAVLVAFVHELIRRDGRKNLVESLTGSFAGQTVAVLSACWLLLPATTLGVGAIVVAAVAAAVARIPGVLPLPERVRTWGGIVVGTAAAAGVSVIFPAVRMSTGVLIGAGVTIVVLSLDHLITYRVRIQASVGLVAAAIAPVAAAGTAAYAAARLVGASGA